MAGFSFSAFVQVDKRVSKVTLSMRKRGHRGVKATSGGEYDDGGVKTTSGGEFDDRLLISGLGVRVFQGAGDRACLLPLTLITKTSYKESRRPKLNVPCSFETSFTLVSAKVHTASPNPFLGFRLGKENIWTKPTVQHN